jgi:hypothetical protein
VAYTRRVNEFGCGWRGVAVAVLLGPAKEGLFQVEAFAEGGVVVVYDNLIRLDVSIPLFIWYREREAAFVTNPVMVHCQR